MINNLIRYILILSVLLLFTKHSFSQISEKEKRSSRIGKRDAFTTNTKIYKHKIGKGDNSKGVPDPGDGDDGWPIPIGSGTGFILLGGVLYFLIKKKSDNKITIK